jgi:hypothetical protein
MKFARSLLVCLVTANALLAQQATPVNQTLAAPPQGYQQIIDYNGTNNVTYVGLAASDQTDRNVINYKLPAVSSATNANPVVFTVTAHGFDYQSGATVLPSVCITGGTGNWTAVNGCWVATPTSANAFSVPVDSTAFGAVTGTLVATTRSPRTTTLCWSIQKFVYSASNLLIWSGWAANPTGAGSTNQVAGTTGPQFAWASRTTYAFQ